MSKKVRCKYCDTLHSASDRLCPNCGKDTTVSKILDDGGSDTVLADTSYYDGSGW